MAMPQRGDTIRRRSAGDGGQVEDIKCLGYEGVSA